jgi:lycopene beta-cyclase
MSTNVVVVGGGLSGTLAALALAEAGPGATVTLIEGAERLGGNHTWSFHETDLDADEGAFIAPFVSWRWPEQIVRFPRGERRLSIGYATVSSERFDRLASARLTRAGCLILLGVGASHVGPRLVRLADGRELAADLVVDARGSERATPAGGFQKFLGLELELESAGPWSAPVIMDATVPQREGYHFVYVLPLTPRLVLVEDTIYADRPELDPPEMERHILDYAARVGARVLRVRRRESGVLPLPVRAETEVSGFLQGPLRIGYRGGFFHPVTGYSLPLAVRVARALARAGTAPDMRDAVASLAAALAPQRRFGCFLNRLLFDALPPEQRWTALDRFYRLPERTIARFYACRSSALDRARVLIGRPPAGVSWRRLVAGAEAA